MIKNIIDELPIGFSEVIYANKKYGVTKTDFNNGKSVKVFAEELGGNNFISFNFYVTSNNKTLLPCEMSKEKVMHFLKNLEIL